MPSPSQKRRQQPPTHQAPELVDPAFLLKGFGIIFGVALILAYVTLCVVYSRSQWQLVLHPSRTLTATPTDFGLKAEEVRFGVDASGQPQLDGWWMPAEADSSRTVLMLHSATGSMADAIGTAAMFHDLGLNLLLFDYRGYGRSGGDHPTEALMEADATSALTYLTETRKLPATSTVIYGHDLGASLALRLCEQVKTCPAMLLDAPDGDLLDRASHDLRSRAVPASLLFHERFPFEAPLAASSTPKLVMLHSNNEPSQTIRDAGNPKMILSVRPGDDASLRSGIQRFLDSYSPR